MASVLPGKMGLNYIYIINIFLHSFSLCPNLCDPMDCSTPGLPVHHQLPEFTQTHVHRVHDAIQPSHPLLPLSPPAFNLSQHQGLFKWVISSHQVAKVVKFQLQHQFFQLIFRADLVARNRIQLWVIPAREFISRCGVAERTRGLKKQNQEGQGPETLLSFPVSTELPCGWFCSSYFVSLASILVSSLSGPKAPEESKSLFSDTCQPLI